MSATDKGYSLLEMLICLMIISSISLLALNYHKVLELDHFNFLNEYLIRQSEAIFTKKFSDYEEWDSLAGLSILAMLDADYHTSMKAADILAYDSIEAFCKDVISRK